MLAGAAQLIDSAADQPPATAVVHAWRRLVDRPHRVVYMAVAAALLSAADLAKSLFYLTSCGLVEANPVSAWVMSWGSAWAVVGWKCATAGVFVGAVLLARRRLSAEIACAVGVVALVFVQLAWIGYAEAALQTGGELAEMHPGRVAFVEPAF